VHLRPICSPFFILFDQSIALRAPAVHGVSSYKGISNYAILKNDTFLEVLLSKCLCVSRDRFPSSFFLLGGMVSKFGAGAFRYFLDQLVYFRNHASRVRIE